jgi:imidazolonepropionase
MSPSQPAVPDPRPHHPGPHHPSPNTHNLSSSRPPAPDPRPRFSSTHEATPTTHDLLLVRHAGQLLTLSGSAGPRRGAQLRDLGIIENGAVLIRDGTILAAGPASEVEKDAHRAIEIDAAGRVVMPGFVDSHTHLVFGVPRLMDYEMRLNGATYPQIAAAGGGILSSMRAVRAMAEADLESGAREFRDAMFRHGTTTVEAKSGYGLDEQAEMKLLRVIASIEAIPTFLGAHVCPPEYAPDDYVDLLCSEWLPHIRKANLAEFADVYCDSGAFTLAQSRRYLERARSLGFGIKIHAEQFSPSGAARLAVELEAVSADHLEQAGDRDAEALGRSGVICTLLPGSVFHLALHHYAPARTLIDAGAAVAVATDFNPGTSPTYSMQMVLSLACTEMRMTPAEAIAAATINGAHALRRGDRIGSLEPGKEADLIVVNASDYREIPYYFGANNVMLTLKRGLLCPNP